MSEEKKYISVSDFMASIHEVNQINSEKNNIEFNSDSIKNTEQLAEESEPEVLISVESLPEEDKKEIEKELEKQERQVEINDLDIKNIIGVLPIEPVIIMASIGESEKLGDLNSIGIPGFINPNSGDFFLLDGSVPDSVSLRKKVKEYVEKRA